MKTNLILLAFLFLSILCFGQKLPFQGKLIEDGTVVEGTRTFVFEIEAVNWSETHADVTVTDGLYFVVLGSITPLPDSLFYGVTEQNMKINVNGTALSPVVLFKPLTSPFEGGAITVKNTEGTEVGSLHFSTDTIGECGEMVVSGTNGNPNVSVGGFGSYGVNGQIKIQNSEGNSKLTMTSMEENGDFVLSGENNSELRMTMYSDQDGNRDYPSLVLEKDDLWYARMYTSKYDTATYGQMYVAGDDGSWNRMRTDGYFIYRDGAPLSQYRVHNWGGNGYSAYFDLKGPNTTNVELGAKYWANSDLPWFKLMGSQSQDVAVISAYEDDTESGHLELYSLDGKQTFLNSTMMVFKDTTYGHAHLVELGTNNNSGNGSTGYLNISAPNSGNIWMGAREMENINLPQINLHGENDFHGMELSMFKDENGDQFGGINLMSENGKSFYLNPFGFGNEKVRLNTETTGNSVVGHIEVLGNSTTNLTMGGRHWEDNGDLPYLHMFGTNDGNNDFHAIDVSLLDDGSESGYIRLAEKTNRYNWMSAREINLHNTNGEQNVSLRIDDDGNGNDWGRIELTSYDNKAAYFDSKSLILKDIEGNHRHLAEMTINNHSDAGYAGYINLMGPSTGNIHMGTRHWEGASDLPLINLNGENDYHAMELTIFKDESSKQFGGINLMSESGHHTSVDAREVNLHNAGDGRTVSLATDNDGQGNEWGRIELNSFQNKTAYLDYRTLALKDLDNGHKHLAEIMTHDNSGNGWAGYLSLSGTNSNNIFMGTREWESTELPLINLHGNSDFHGMEISVAPDGNGDQQAFIIMRSENGNDKNYNADGIWGTGPLTIGMDVVVNGTVTESSDKRFKINIQALGNNTLKKVEILEGVSYNWRCNEFPEKNFSSDKQIGLIAQQLEKQFPELVKTDKEGYKSVNYNGFTAVLLEAVKELNNKVEKLENENLNLQKELTASVAKLSEIEQIKDQLDALTKMVKQNGVFNVGDELTSVKSSN